MAKKCEECGINCLEGKGCIPLIDVAEQVGLVVATYQQHLADQTRSMQDHSEISKTFWEEQQKQVGTLVDQVKECLEGTSEAALRFNDGHHRMGKNENDIQGVAEKLRNHEDGKRGQHSLLAKSFTKIGKSLGLIRKSILAGFFTIVVLTIFVAKKHPELLDIILKYI